MLLGLNRATYYYKAKAESSCNLMLMQEIDRIFMKWPFFGVRQMRRHLRSLGHCVGDKRVRRLMRLMGIMAVYQKPRTSIQNPMHKKYPYLLRDVAIERSNQAWCTDITYIPMRKGFLYLVAIMDWHSRAVLSWRLSNSMDTDFCVAALEEALDKYGPQRYSTLIRAASLPAIPSLMYCRRMGYAYPWMVAAAGWTTCSSNDFGGH